MRIERAGGRFDRVVGPLDAFGIMVHASRPVNDGVEVCLVDRRGNALGRVVGRRGGNLVRERFPLSHVFGGIGAVAELNVSCNALRGVVTQRPPALGHEPHGFGSLLGGDAEPRFAEPPELPGYTLGKSVELAGFDDIVKGFESPANLCT